MSTSAVLRFDDFEAVVNGQKNPEKERKTVLGASFGSVAT